jgi:hypothetical protein
MGTFIHHDPMTSSPGAEVRMHESGTTGGSRGALPWASERGKAQLGGLLMVLVLVCGVYLGMKFVPVRSAAYQFDDTVREQVVYAGARRRRMGDQEVMRNLMEAADELRLPITHRNVRITRRAKSIRIQVAYIVPIELPFDFTYDWTFIADHEGPSF